VDDGLPELPMNSGSLLPDDTGGRDVAVRAAAPAIVSVSLLVATARRVVEREIGLLWVAGEISGFRRAASGHCYFDLKDASAQVSCVFFRHKAQHAGFPLRDGIAVELRATASIYEARGSFQLNVESIRLAGLGALYEQFARLKARLEASGWFAPERKRPLPAFPRAVGIVTSTSGAAVHDVLTALARRWPALPVIVYPCSVQGAGAAAEIAAAIATANARREVDVLIVGRGGGSIEDLWAFNEETVARAVLDSALPVVSAVGHETDFTICDFVADARAATPTAAAALVAPDRAAIAQRLDALAGRLWRAGAKCVEDRMQRADQLARRLVHPAARLDRQGDQTRAVAQRLALAFGHRLAALDARLGHEALRLAAQLRAPQPGSLRLGRTQERWLRAGPAMVDGATRRLAAAGQALAHLNPQSVLDRGYAIVTRADGGIVRDASTLAVADEVGLRLARGTARARVTDTDSGNGSPA
jgi:exodeoxyribonuclease VII large subunit